MAIRNEKKEKRTTMISGDVASKFIHKLSHDVAGITHNIKGYATLLEEEYNQEYLDGISRLIAKLEDKIKKAVSDVDEGELEKLSQA
jgi:nitrogen-specific signal transduction histidine kinase